MFSAVEQWDYITHRTGRTGASTPTESIWGASADSLLHQDLWRAGVEFMAFVLFILSFTDVPILSSSYFLMSISTDSDIFGRRIKTVWLICIVMIIF